MNLTLGYSIPSANDQRRWDWSVGILSFFGNWRLSRAIAIYFAKSSIRNFVSIRMQLDGILHYLKTEDIVVEEIPMELRKVAALLENLVKRVADLAVEESHHIQLWKTSIESASKSANELLRYVKFLHEVEQMGTNGYHAKDQILLDRIASKNLIQIDEDKI